MAKYAYADPPYIGMAKIKYGEEEVDHEALIEKLYTEFPDGWALSCSSPTLKQILNMCKNDVRVMAWVKPFAVFRPNVNPAYAWEPVIVKGGRKKDRFEDTVRDWVSCNITLRRGLVGAKPEGFCMWLFDVLGMKFEDEFVDLYPGTGAVTKAWEKWKNAQQAGT